MGKSRTIFGSICPMRFAHLPRILRISPYLVENVSTGIGYWFFLCCLFRCKGEKIQLLNIWSRIVV